MSREENARTVFEQYWLHARHVENERLWLTNIFVIIFGGLLAYMSTPGVWLVWYIAGFGVGLSIFGLLTVHALRVAWLRFSRMAETIMAVELGLEEYRRFFRRAESKGLRVALDKFWGLHRTFVLFYCLSASAWAALVARSLEASWLVSFLVFLIVLAILVIGYHLIFWPRETQVEEELRQQSEKLKTGSEKAE